MQGRLHANFAVIVLIALLFTNSQALPLLDQPTNTNTQSLQRSNDGSSRNEHEQNVNRSKGAHGGIQGANRADDTDPIIPLYDIAHRRDELPPHTSTNGFELPQIESIVKPSIKSNRDVSSSSPFTVPKPASNPSSTSPTTTTDGQRAVPAYFAKGTNLQPYPSVDNTVRPAQAHQDKLVQADQGTFSRRRRFAPLTVPFPVRASTQTLTANPEHQIRSVPYVHHLYRDSYESKRHTHKSNEHNGHAGVSKPKEELRRKPVQPFSFFGGVPSQFVLASHERPLNHPSKAHTHAHVSPVVAHSDTHTDAHMASVEAGRRLGFIEALRVMHNRLLPLFLGRRPHSPYITVTHHTTAPHTPFRRPLPYHRPAGPNNHHHKNHHPAHANAGTIHMSSPSLTHSHPLPIAFTLSPEICAPLALDCECMTKDLASRLLASYPTGIPASTNSITETVSMIMHGIEYRATLDLKLDKAINGKHFKDFLGLLVSVKKELVNATHGRGFGTAHIKGNWHGVAIEASWTYYKFEHGIVRRCS